MPNPSALPAILAGPIVRKLTGTSVSIWLATPGPMDAELVVAPAMGAGDAVRAPAQSAQVGAHLWLHLFTATDPGGFTPNTVYTYDLALRSGNWPGDGRPPALDALALPGFRRPSFRALPTTATELRFGQASCRKPHGGDGTTGCRDAVAQFTRGLDADPFALDGDRLHAVFHTGDQIYADDVAGPLMPILQGLDRDLIRGAANTHGAEPSFDPLPPIGGRERPSTAMGLTAGAVAKDHLWRLGEFAAMYLLAWSDICWPDTLPAWNAGRIADVDNPDGTGRIKALSEEVWAGQIAALETFRATLPNVRRVLANTANFMMFDDHEITDDWNLDHAWFRRVYANAQGRAVIRNGLAAYTAFQHWGNAPERFAQPGTPERSVLDALDAGHAEGTDLALALPPQDAIPEPPEPAPGTLLPPLRSMDGDVSIRFDYRLGPAQGWPVQVAALDPRTARAYPNRDAAIGRIAAAALDAMLPSPSAAEVELPLIISLPAPFLGMNLLEHVIQPITELLPGGRQSFDVEPWTAYGQGYETFIARLGEFQSVIALSGDVHYGFTRALRRTEQNQLSRAAQFTASASKNAEIKTMAIHTLGDVMADLSIVRPRIFWGYDRLNAQERRRFLRPPRPRNGATPALPWDDMVDVALGRVLRAATEEPAVFSREVAEAYGLDRPRDFEYEVDPVEDTSAPPAQVETLMDRAIDAANARAAPWDPDASFKMLEAAQGANLHSLGRAICGLPQVAELRLLQEENGPLLAQQTLLVAAGNADGTGSDVDATVTTTVPLTGAPST